MIGLAQDLPLAIAQYSCFGPHGLMGILKAYFDGSGTKADPGVLIVAGYVAHADTWTAFENDWKAALEPFGIPALHMKDFAHFNGDFAGWSDCKRRALLENLAPVIGRHAVRGFSAGIDLRAYRRARAMFQLPTSLLPYPMAVSAAIQMSEKWARKDGSGKVDYKLEDGDEDQKYVGDALEFFRIDLIAKPQCIKKSWEDEDGEVHWCYPFQAADYLAYEHAKSVKDRQDGRHAGEPRGSLGALLRATDAFRATECVYFGLSSYVALCVERSIPLVAAGV